MFCGLYENNICLSDNRKSPKRDGNPVASFTVDSYNTIVSPKNEQIPGHGHAPSHGHGHGHGDDSNAGGGIIIAD